MNIAKKSIGLLLSLILSISALFTVPATTASASGYDGQTVKIGNLDYDPGFKTYEQWKTLVPDLKKFEISQDGEFVLYGYDTYGSRYLKLEQPIGVRAPLTVRKGETVVLDLNGWRCINFTERGTMLDVEEGGTLFILDSHSISKSTYTSDSYIFSNIKDAIIANVNGNMVMLGGFFECISGPDSGGYNMYIGEKGVVHINGGGLLRKSSYSYMYANSSYHHIDPKSKGEIHLYNGYVLTMQGSRETNPLCGDNSSKVIFHTDEVLISGGIYTPEEAFKGNEIWGDFFFGEKFIYEYFTPNPKGEGIFSNRIEKHVGETLKVDTRYIYSGTYQPCENGLKTMLSVLGYDMTVQYWIQDKDKITDKGSTYGYKDEQVIDIKANKPGTYFVLFKYEIKEIGFCWRTHMKVEVLERPIEEARIVTTIFADYQTDFSLSTPAVDTVYSLFDPGKWTNAQGNELTGEPKIGVIYRRKVVLEAADGWKFDEDTEVITLNTEATVKPYYTSLSADGKYMTIYLSAQATHNVHRFEEKYDDDYHWEACIGCSLVRNKSPHSLRKLGSVASDGKAEYECSACKFKERLECPADGEIIKNITVLLKAPLHGDSAEQIIRNITIGSTNLVCCDITGITLKNGDGSEFDSAIRGSEIKYTVSLKAKDGYIFASDLRHYRRFPTDLSGKEIDRAGAVVSSDGKTATLTQTIPGNKVLIPATVKFSLPDIKTGESFASKAPVFSSDNDALDPEQSGYTVQLFWQENEKSYLVMFDSDGNFNDLSSNGLTEAPIFKNDISYKYYAVPKGTKSGYKYSYEMSGSGSAYPGTVGEGEMFLLIATAPCAYGEYFKAEDENKIMSVSLSVKQPKAGERPGETTDRITLPAYANYTVTEAVFKDAKSNPVDVFSAGEYTLTVMLRANGTVAFSPMCAYSVNGETVLAEGASDSEKTVTAHFVIKAAGGSISGNVKSFGEDGDNTYVTLTELGQSKPIQSKHFSDTSFDYSFTDIEAGVYTLRITNAKHITKEYTLTVNGDESKQNTELRLIGDIDSSRSITVADALMALQCSVHQISLEGENYEAANVNADDRITATDALLILQYTVGKIEDFPAYGE